MAATVEFGALNYTILFVYLAIMIAIGVAFYVSMIEHVLAASSKFLSLFAAPILAIFLLGILTRRAKFWGWLAGTAVAIPTTLLLQDVVKVHFVWYFPICFGITFVIGYCASLVLPGQLGQHELTLWGRKNLQPADSA